MNVDKEKGGYTPLFEQGKAPYETSEFLINRFLQRTWYLQRRCRNCLTISVITIWHVFNCYRACALLLQPKASSRAPIVIVQIRWKLADAYGSCGGPWW